MDATAAAKTTGDLLQELKDTAHIRDYMKTNEPDLITTDFAGELKRLFDGQGRKKAEIAREAGISDIYLYQIFSGKRVPTRDRLICICMGMLLSMEDPQRLLRLCVVVELEDEDCLFAASEGVGVGVLDVDACTVELLHDLGHAAWMVGDGGHHDVGLDDGKARLREHVAALDVVVDDHPDDAEVRGVRERERRYVDVVLRKRTADAGELTGLVLEKDADLLDGHVISSCCRLRA